MSRCRAIAPLSSLDMLSTRAGSDDVLNTGTFPYVLFVTFPRVPQGDSARTDEPDLDTCGGSLRT